ncbi:dihydrofolate reductase family protein [Solicola gregarius]|uniref:Dihydrofolate reductase family protein n=1 Tax=Solicola gregarius TaxID=2908642 RepID=A0AA46TL10_9ACTN|nr:dihydrofolate reductase family protein [Solicola gregarius]UYM07252.1 dihydrofolate reductase family protein [Solicola gregarius]
MGKIVNATYMSLDGDISNMEDWHFEYFGDEEIKAAQDQLAEADALVMGRETYDGFFPAWSSRAGADDFSDRMNSMKKYVVSSTLTDPEWTNTTVIGDDVAGEIRRIKQDNNLLQYGFGDVSRLMVTEGLLDEFRVWLHPVLSGKATPDQRLYRDMPQQKFTVTDVDRHASGIVILTYTVA